MIKETEKRCSRCGEIRKRTRFFKKSAARDGLTPECNICQRDDYEQRKIGCKIKIYETGCESFKSRYGVAYTTIRDWLVREYDKGKSEYWLLKQIPIEERAGIIQQYKIMKLNRGKK